jgi:hypothetical protein
MLETNIPVGGPFNDPDLKLAQAKIASAKRRMGPVRHSLLGRLVPKAGKIEEGFAILDKLAEDDTIR